MDDLNLCTKYKLEDILTEKQIHHILKEEFGEDEWEFLGCKMSLAVEGLAGFLGDHFRVALCVKLRAEIKKIHLFIKCLPLENKPKAKFIDDFNYFRREMVLFKLFDDLGGVDGQNQWRAKAYIYSESLLVMPDLSTEGYAMRPYYEELDLKHVLLTVASIARFHAAFANYETKRNDEMKVTSKFFEEYEEILREPTFDDTPWLAAAANLTGDLLQEFSNKYYFPNLREKLHKIYIEACHSLRMYEDSLNVVIHKDLWMNNILFKYVNGEATECVLLDFQCVRYAPPAFDVMIFLYLNTSREFRGRYENTVFREYFEAFIGDLDERTRRRLGDLKYNYEDFLKWCERARMFGCLDAIAIFPFVLMEPAVAQRNFDDPDTYMRYMHDRSAPVLQHARQCDVYRNRQMEVSEEFFQRYVSEKRL